MTLQTYAIWLGAKKKEGVRKGYSNYCWGYKRGTRWEVLILNELQEECFID